MAASDLQELNSRAPLHPRRGGSSQQAWMTKVQVGFLRIVAPNLPTTMNGGAYVGKSKLLTLLPGIEQEIKGKIVLDFGCGAGSEVRELALLGAKSVVGLDRSEKWLRVAREEAGKIGIADHCHFVSEYDGVVDAIISLDCFEHFGDPAAFLETMYSMLSPGGAVLVSFGPTWYHPLGGHLFSVFPWAHLLLQEEALIGWRAQFKQDGATRFGEVEGGLNQMTIRRFESILAQSPFTVEKFELVPIRKTKPLHNRFTREFLTAIVRCKLKKPGFADREQTA
jgi:SAM-dependent methyltransferase